MSEAVAVNLTTHKVKVIRKNYSLEEQAVYDTIIYLKKEIDRVNNMFSIALDDCLVDAYIYEIKSLEMKYKYYLREAKRIGLYNVDFSDVRQVRV